MNFSSAFLFKGFQEKLNIDIIKEEIRVTLAYG